MKVYCIGHKTIPWLFLSCKELIDFDRNILFLKNLLSWPDTLLKIVLERVFLAIVNKTDMTIFGLPLNHPKNSEVRQVKSEEEFAKGSQDLVAMTSFSSAQSSVLVCSNS